MVVVASGDCWLRLLEVVGDGDCQLLSVVFKGCGCNYWSLIVVVHGCQW